MSEIIKKLKKLRDEYRINKNDNIAFVSFVISEIETVGKNKGNRLTTDEEAIKKLKTMVENIENNIKVVKDDNKKNVFLEQIKILSPLIPALVSTEEVEKFLADKSFSNIQEYVKALKDHFGSSVDMKKAMELVNKRVKDKK